MATPNDRRVIWGSHVVPQVSYSTTNTQVTREEGSTAGTASYTKYKLDTTVAKRFGGKGSVDIKSDQGSDEWVSFLSPVDQLWEAVDNVWNLTSAVWDNAFYVGNTPGTTHPTNLRTDGGTVDFLYIKNLGDVEFTDATCDYNNDPTIAHDDDDAKIKAGMMVSGTGIPADSYVGVRTSDIAFELYSSATGGAVSTTGGPETNETLTFTGVECHLALEGNEYDMIIPGGASVSMRVNGISASDIKVKTLAGTTTIEYIIARTP
jgi:hypothetical protein